ncbi:MAG: hypothetical protein V4501_09275 [Pseudomonadota bacterium]
MKIRNIILSICVALLSQSALADITISFLAAPGGETTDICKNLAGTWEGKGTASSHGITCEYSGSISVMPGDAPASYIGMTTLTLVSGMIMCPESKELELSGSCQNNQLVLKNDDTSLSGSIDKTGKKADLAGYVYFSVLETRIKINLYNVHLEKSDN